MDKNVLVIGLGEVGWPVFKHLLKREIYTNDVEVRGVDVDPETVEALNEDVWARFGDGWKGAITGKRVYESIKEACVNWTPDVVSICVPCDKGPGVIADIICTETGIKPRREFVNSLISIESTLPVISDWEVLYEDIVFFPHRIAPHEDEPFNQPGGMERNLGGLTPEATDRGVTFWSRIYGADKINVTGWQEAILSKIFENAKRAIDIAIAEDFKMIAKEHGVAFSSLRQAINTKWNIELLEARDGIGLHCLPFALRVTERLGSKMSAAAMEVDRSYRTQPEAIERAVSDIIRARKERDS